MSHINTKCIQEGYEPKSGEARVLPIYQSTTFKYEDAKTLGDLFDFNASGHFYTRLSNPTVEAVEKKIAALEAVWAQCSAPRVRVPQLHPMPQRDLKEMF